MTWRPAEGRTPWITSSSGWRSGRRDARRRQRGLLLLTAHRAKGLEFDHVVVLDGGWDRVGRGEDAGRPKRRLYYVAMTRARQTLMLARLPGPHRLHDALKGIPSVLHRQPLDSLPPAEPPELSRVYRRLSLSDVFLSYAGYRRPNDPVHRRHCLTVARRQTLRVRAGLESLGAVGPQRQGGSSTCKQASKAPDGHAYATSPRSWRLSHGAARSQRRNTRAACSVMSGKWLCLSLCLSRRHEASVILTTSWLMERRFRASVKWLAAARTEVHRSQCQRHSVQEDRGWVVCVCSSRHQARLDWRQAGIGYFREVEYQDLAQGCSTTEDCAGPRRSALSASLAPYRSGCHAIIARRQICRVKVCIRLDLTSSNRTVTSRANRRR